jgi:ABC-2 type transport system permease protein
VAVSWMVVPLLFFGIDETLDPARFALLPITRRRLAAGMLAAACVGIMPVTTLLVMLGSTIGAAFDGGTRAALVAVVGAVVGLLLCVVASRAVTSAFSGMLRSRRTRDLAALVIAILGLSCGPLQMLLFALVSQGDTRAGRLVAETLGWTPLGGPFVAYADAIAGRWGRAAAHLAIGLVGVALLLWWWSRTLESAMVGSASGSAARTRPVTGGGPVRALLIRWLPATRFGGLVSREVRYWWRDPRRRSGLISLAMVSIIFPFTAIFSGGGGGYPLPIAVGLAGLFIGLVLTNQFGNDAQAYGAHLLAAVPGQVELRARSAGLVILTGPLLLAGTAGAAVATGQLEQLPEALGTVAAAFGISLGVAGLTSVLAPYAMPDSPNPFATPTGGAVAKGLLSFVSMFAAAALTMPILVAALLLPGYARWLVLPAGVLYGVVGAVIGTYIAGDLLDRRAPEILAAVTPRR